jgi:hypothetical protein
MPCAVLTMRPDTSETKSVSLRGSTVPKAPAVNCKACISTTWLCTSGFIGAGGLESSFGPVDIKMKNNTNPNPATITGAKTGFKRAIEIMPYPY